MLLLAYVSAVLENMIYHGYVTHNKNNYYISASTENTGFLRYAGFFNHENDQTIFFLDIKKRAQKIFIFL